MSRKGRKIYWSATYKLSDELFDCVPEHLIQFRDDFRDRLRQFGLDNDDGILEISTDPSDPVSGTDNLISHYDSVNLKQLEYSRNNTST